MIDERSRKGVMINEILSKGEMRRNKRSSSIGGIRSARPPPKWVRTMHGNPINMHNTL